VTISWNEYSFVDDVAIITEIAHIFTQFASFCTTSTDIFLATNTLYFAILLFPFTKFTIGNATTWSSFFYNIATLFFTICFITGDNLFIAARFV
jgi:hypothetical protein